MARCSSTTTCTSGLPGASRRSSTTRRGASSATSSGAERGAWTRSASPSTSTTSARPASSGRSVPARALRRRPRPLLRRGARGEEPRACRSSSGSRSTACPSGQDELAELLEPYPWDFLLGSVHWIGGLAVDQQPGSGPRARSRRSGASTSRELAGRGAERALRRARAPGPGQDLRRRAAEWDWRAASIGAARRALRSRSRPPACTSRSASSIPTRAPARAA